MASHSSFPVEVMGEIFRSTELDAQDLANCCLLAQRYLESARKWLYNSIELVSTQSLTGEGSTRGIRVELAEQTNRLLDTLNSNPHLGTLVRSILTQIKCERGCLQVPTRRTDSALDQIYPCTPMVNSLYFDIRMTRGSPYLWFNGALPVIGDGLNSQRRLERIRKLSNVYLSTDVLRFLPRLINLQHLSVNVPKDYQSGVLTISRLRSFEIGQVTPNFDLRSFLASTAETIEDLQIPLKTFFDLDLRDYPQLKRRLSHSPITNFQAAQPIG